VDSRRSHGTRELRYRLHGGNRGIGSDTELRKAPRLRQHLAFERTDGGVVRTDCAVQLFAQLLQVRDERVEAAIKLLPHLVNDGGVLGDIRLTPAVRNGLEQGDERR